MTDRAEPEDPLDLDQIERVLRAATPGPWRWIAGKGATLAECRGGDNERVCDFGDDEQYYPTAGREPSDEDATLIANAPTWLAALVAALRDARQRVQELEQEIRLLQVDAQESQERESL